MEIQDEAGRKLAARRLPEGAAGIARLHELIAAHLGADGDPGQVVVAIETDRGAVGAGAGRGRLPGVRAQPQAGRAVQGALQPVRAKKDDAADAHALADMVRAERHQLRAVAADTAGGQAIKVAARAHQTLIWERTRHTLRLRSALRDFFPAALAAYADLGLTAADTLELLARAPAPATAARLTAAQISAALKRARRRGVPARAQAIKDALRGPQLAQPARGHRRLRRYRAGLRRYAGHPERADRAAGGPGGGPFSAAPGRWDLPVPARHRDYQRRPGAR